MITFYLRTPLLGFSFHWDTTRQNFDVQSAMLTGSSTYLWSHHINQHQSISEKVIRFSRYTRLHYTCLGEYTVCVQCCTVDKSPSVEKYPAWRVLTSCLCGNQMDVYCPNSTPDRSTLPLSAVAGFFQQVNEKKRHPEGQKEKQRVELIGWRTRSRERKRRREIAQSRKEQKALQRMKQRHRERIMCRGQVNFSFQETETSDWLKIPASCYCSCLQR